MADKNTSPPAAAGEMNFKDFSPQQNLALLDLLVLAMYLDGNLAKVEEARVQQLLGAMGFASDYDRNRQFDESVTRIRRQSQTPEAVNIFATGLAGQFTSSEQRQRVFGLLSDLTALDGNVSQEESKFLSAVKKAFTL